MVDTRTCNYSGEEIEPGTGTMYVKTDGTILHFKDSKAEKNYFMGREARELEWTQAGRGAGGAAGAGETAEEQAAEPEPSPSPDLDAAEEAVEGEETGEQADDEAVEAEAAAVEDEEQ